MYRVAAFDPGQTTGIALFTGPPITLVSAADWPWHRWRKLADLLTTFNPTQVVIEDFKVYRGMGEALALKDLPSPVMIGMIEMANYLTVDVPVQKQMASMRTKVKILDHHKPKLKGLHHANDAYKHGRLWIVKNCLNL